MTKHMLDLDLFTTYRQNEDFHAVYDLNEQIIEEYLTATEIDPNENRTFTTSGPHYVLQFGLDFLNLTLPEIEAAEVEEILFDILPRKLTIDDHTGIIPSLEAFYAYIGEVYGLSQATGILNFLSKAHDVFSAEMDNPANWGMAKSVMMQGMIEGVDLTSESKIDNFLQAHTLSQLQSIKRPTAKTQLKKRSKSKQKGKRAARANRKRNKKRR